MTIAEMMQLPVLAGREDAAQKLFAYNDLVMEMSGKINLTGIKDPEESLIKNVYDSLTVYDEKYFPENAKLLSNILTIYGAFIFPGVDVYGASCLLICFYPFPNAYLISSIR